MATYKWQDIKGKFYSFDFGDKGKVSVSVGGVRGMQRLRNKLSSIEEKVNWDLFKNNVQTIKKKQGQ